MSETSPAAQQMIELLTEIRDLLKQRPQQYWKSSEKPGDKANRLGLKAKPGESWEAFERRINQTRG